MQTWQRGRASLMARLLREQKPVRDFLEDLKRDPPVRVAGTAIFLDRQGLGHTARAAQQHQVQPRDA